MPTYSFYSITEVSEYVPDADDYARILREREGLDPDSSMFKAKLGSYAERLGPDEPPAAVSRFPRLAVPLFLSDEQDAHRRPELVLAPI